MSAPGLSWLPGATGQALATLCGVDKAHINYRIGKADLPTGQLSPSGGKREFALADARRLGRGRP